MVNDTEDITLYNLRYNSETRRETAIATTISGVTVYQAAGTSGGKDRTENNTVKIRIPLTASVQDDRTYIPEEGYAALSDTEAESYWTIQKGSVFFIGDPPVSADNLSDLQAAGALTVVDYSDNTRRGSEKVQHWRIGGA